MYLDPVSVRFLAGPRLKKKINDVVFFLHQFFQLAISQGRDKILDQYTHFMGAKLKKIQNLKTNQKYPLDQLCVDPVLVFKHFLFC